MAGRWRKSFKSSSEDAVSMAVSRALVLTRAAEMTGLDRHSNEVIKKSQSRRVYVILLPICSYT